MAKKVAGLIVVAVVVSGFAFITLWMAAYALTAPGMPTYMVWPILVAIVAAFGAAGVIMGRRYIAEANIGRSKLNLEASPLVVGFGLMFVLFGAVLVGAWVGGKL